VKYGHTIERAASNASPTARDIALVSCSSENAPPSFNRPNAGVTADFRARFGFERAVLYALHVDRPPTRALDASRRASASFWSLVPS
jgi:hypothetical protein